MELRIAGHVIAFYNEVKVNLKYDSIADTFSFKVYFDPNNPAHKAIFKPGSYQTCEIYHNDQKLITGTILSYEFSDSEVKEWTNIAGYSITGVLEDTRILNFPLQFNGMSLKEIATAIITDAYGLDVVIDDNVAAECNINFAATTEHPNPTIDQTVKDFLDNISKQKNIVLSHDQNGAVLFTKVRPVKVINEINTVTLTPDTLIPQEQKIFSNRSKTTFTKPIFDFNDRSQWTKMCLSVDGQKMHGVVQVLGQQDSKNAKDAVKLNPFVIANDAVELNPFVIKVKFKPFNPVVFNNSGTKFSGAKRYYRYIQTSGDDDQTKITARAIIGDELKSIELTIEVPTWELNGILITPNQLITVTNPDCYLYRKTTWFIREVAFTGNEKEERATMSCVLPFCFNNDTLVNIFD